MDCPGQCDRQTITPASTAGPFELRFGCQRQYPKQDRTASLEDTGPAGSGRNYALPEDRKFYRAGEVPRIQSGRYTLVADCKSVSCTEQDRLPDEEACELE